MNWVDKMLVGIKDGCSRMEIAEQCGIPVGHISKYANVLLRTHEYRDEGITDKEFAEWYEASLIGLRTAEGELCIERSKPNPENVARILHIIHVGFKPDAQLPKMQKRTLDPKKIKRNCRGCRYYTNLSNRCPYHAYEYGWSDMVGCTRYREKQHYLIHPGTGEVVKC